MEGGGTRGGGRGEGKGKGGMGKGEEKGKLGEYRLGCWGDRRPWAWQGTWQRQINVELFLMMRYS